jgi:hypothetical protein
MFRVTQYGFDLQSVLLMCWINAIEHQHASEERVWAGWAE